MAINDHKGRGTKKNSARSARMNTDEDTQHVDGGACKHPRGKDGMGGVMDLPPHRTGPVIEGWEGGGGFLL